MKLCEMSNDQISALDHDYIEYLCSKKHALLDIVWLEKDIHLNYKIKPKGDTEEEKEANQNRFTLLYGILLRNPASKHLKTHVPKSN